MQIEFVYISCKESLVVDQVKLSFDLNHFLTRIMIGSNFHDLWPNKSQGRYLLKPSVAFSAALKLYMLLANRLTED